MSYNVILGYDHIFADKRTQRKQYVFFVHLSENYE